MPGCLIQGVLHLPAASVLKKYNRPKGVHSMCPESVMENKASMSTVDLTLSDDERDVPRKRRKPSEGLSEPQGVTAATGAAAQTPSQVDLAKRRIMQQAAQVCHRAASLSAGSYRAG